MALLAIGGLHYALPPSMTPGPNWLLLVAVVILTIPAIVASSAELIPGPLNRRKRLGHTAFARRTVCSGKVIDSVVRWGRYRRNQFSSTSGRPRAGSASVLPIAPEPFQRVGQHGGFLLAVVAAVASPALASNLTVNPGQLQAALDSANPGDRILLNPGTYAETITARRGGQAGAPITITRATATTPVLTGHWVVRAPYVTASRLIFDGSAYNDYPIWVTQGDGVYGSFFTLEKSEVRNAAQSGIFVGDTSPPMPLQGVAIRGCYFHDNGTSGSYDHGIYIKSGSNHLIEGNLILRSSGFGIQNYPHAQGLVIRRNEIRQNGAGILIEHDIGDELPMVNNTLVDGNYLKDNRGMGIALMYAGDVSIVPAGISNAVTNNWAAGNVGGQYGRDGTLGNSDYTRGATWSGNVYGDPPGAVLVPTSAVGPDAGAGAPAPAADR